MKNLLLSFLVIIVLTSCEPVYEAGIKNETNNEVIIQLIFDEAEYRKSWGDKPLLPYLNRYFDSPYIKILNADTMNLKYSFSIESGKTFPIESGIGYKPDFELIKELHVLKPDTMMLTNKIEIGKAFDEIDTRDFILRIK